jgi:monofunctional biosynthetic peptidoglycan transglycosylase
VLLTLNLPKQRILTIYMNIAELGNGIFGVDAASHAYFHKSPAQLTPREAALLAATLPNPHIYHPSRPSSYVLRRAAWIEQQMFQLGGPAYLPK